MITVTYIIIVRPHGESRVANRVNCWNAKARSAMPISNQATHVGVETPRGVDGSETSRQAKAVILPRVPGTLRGGDIVRSPRETVGALVNSARC